MKGRDARRTWVGLRALRPARSSLPWAVALALAASSGSAPTFAAARPRAAKAEAPVDKRVAVVAPADPGPAKAVLAKVLDAVETDLSRAGFQVITPAQVAAAYRKRRVAMPTCRATSGSCLAEIAQTVGSGFVVAIGVMPGRSGVDVESTIVEAGTAFIVSRSALLPAPWTGPLTDVPRPASTLLRFLSERSAQPAGVDRPAVAEPAPTARPAPEPLAPTAVPPGEPSKPPEANAALPPAPPASTSGKAPTSAEPTAASPAGPGPSASKPATAEPAGPSTPAGELLAQARKAYEALEFDRAASLAGRVLAFPGIDSETRLDAYLVQASSLAIAADTQSSEVSFRLLLRARPDFEMPRQTPPKILAVFRKVQSEERAIADQVRSVARRRLVEGLQLFGEPPARAVGGRPLPFSFRLRDPTSAVTAFDVPYRRHGEGGYSVLALQRDPEGAWKGAIPAEWTASEAGFDLEYYLLARDEVGPLLGRGEAASPLRLSVSPGQVERALPRPVPRWALWTLAAGTVVAGLAAGGLGVGTVQAQADYDRYAQQAVTSPKGGATLVSMGRSGHALADATVGMAIASSVLLAATLAVWPFTAPAEPAPEAR